MFLFIYLFLLPWTRHLPLPELPVVIVWADLFFLLLFLRWLGALLTTRSLRIFSRLEKSAFLFLAILAAATCFAEPVLRTWLKFIGIAYLVFLIPVLKHAVKEKQTLTRVFQIWFWVAFILSVIGIAAYLAAWGQQQPNFFILKDSAYLRQGEFLWRIQSIGYSCNMFAAYLQMGIVSGLWLMTKESGSKRRKVILAAIGVILLAVILCKTRLFLGALATLAVVGLSRWRNYSSSRRLLCGAFCAFVLGFAGLVTASLWYQITPVTVRSDGENHAVAWNKDPSIYRFLNLLAFALFREHWVRGTGLGGYRSFSQRPQEILVQDHPEFLKVLPQRWTDSPHDPHSTYQGWAAETGMIGMSGILILLVGLVNEVREKNRVLTAAVVGFLINGFYMDILMLRYFWFLCACIAMRDQ